MKELKNKIEDETLPQKFSEEFLKALYLKRMQRIDDLLNENPDIDFGGRLPGGKRATLFLHAANVDCYQALKLLMDKFNERYMDISESERIAKLRSIVNFQNSIGLTPLHYACFHGSLNMIRILVHAGADPKIKAETNQTIHHLAIENDQVLALFYFRDIVSINDKNDYGMTPLIYACDRNSEACVYFLISMGADLNARDNEGRTAIHRAAMNGNTRLVRRLVRRGVKKELRDIDGARAMDIAIARSYVNVQQQLKSSSCFWNYVDVTAADSKLNKGRFRLYCTLLFILILMPLNFVSGTPYNRSNWLELLALSTYPLLVLFLVLSWQVDPGFLKSTNDHTNVMNLMADNQAYKVCPDCTISKPKRSRHCDSCGHCIKVFDHHCPFINNCVGANNLKYFILFLITLFICTGITAAYLVLTIVEKKPVNDKEDFFKISEYSDDIRYIIKTLLGLVGFFVFVVFFGVGRLFLTQVTNTVKGRTTSERFGYMTVKEVKRSETARSSEDLKEPIITSTLGPGNHSAFYILEEKGCVDNCLDMLCRNGSTQDYEMTSTI